jgi:hypothetical protein
MASMAMTDDWTAVAARPEHSTNAASANDEMPATEIQTQNYYYIAAQPQVLRVYVNQLKAVLA